MSPENDGEIPENKDPERECPDSGCRHPWTPQVRNRLRKQPEQKAWTEAGAAAQENSSSSSLAKSTAYWDKEKNTQQRKTVASRIHTVSRSYVHGTVQNYLTYENIVYLSIYLSKHIL